MLLPRHLAAPLEPFYVSNAFLFHQLRLCLEQHHPINLGICNTLQPEILAK